MKEKDLERFLDEMNETIWDWFKQLYNTEDEQERRILLAKIFLAKHYNEEYLYPDLKKKIELLEESNPEIKNFVEENAEVLAELFGFKQISFEGESDGN